MKPCLKRQDNKCVRTDCASFNQEVTPQICAECPLRVPFQSADYSETVELERSFDQPKLLEDGTLVYPKTGWEPPKAPDGFVAKSSDPRNPLAWSFTPLWPRCIERETVNAVLPCGCLGYNAFCTSVQSVKNGLPVILTDCMMCPVRTSVGASDKSQQ